jgi:hypothetical protein
MVNSFISHILNTVLMSVKETMKSFFYIMRSNTIAYSSNIQCSINNNPSLINNNKNKNGVASVLLAFTSLLVIAFPVNNTVALAVNDNPQDHHQRQQQQKQEQPNINASTVYQTGKMVLGNNIKNLVICLKQNRSLKH